VTAGGMLEFFDPENGGDIFLRNVGCLTMDNTAFIIIIAVVLIL
jgi:hypothetical protein